MDDSGIQNLVCESCWEGLFSTEDFWEACQGDPTRSGPLHAATHRAVHVKKGSPSGMCEWCAFIKTTNYASGELVGDIRFGQARDNTHTPIGRNHWRFDTERHKFQVLAFTDAEDKAAAYVTARPVQTNVNTCAAIAQVKAWLEACESHANCSPMHGVPLPTRVIQVSPRESPTRSRIRSTNKTTGRYAALSYCWGGPQPGSLTKHNFVQYSSALPLDDLSQTVRDAIEVARKVGVEYLWVDALCILQDSDQDKAQEISAMDQIFSNALFTIAAASASGAQQGFLGPRATPSSAHRVPFRCPDGSLGTMLLRAIFEEPFHLSHLDERAWTFQEEFLFSRLVIYDLRTLRWSCKEGAYHLGASYCSETSKNSLAQWISSSYLDPSYATWKWANELIYMYSRRKHSVSSDKLTALSAVAKALAPKFGCSYVAGLWRNDLPMQLLWRSGWVTATVEHSRPAIYRAPSWSWASIDGPVGVEPMDWHYPMCNIVHIETEPRNFNAPFAEVANGYMIVEGYLRGGHYSVENDGEFDIASIRWEEDDIHQQEGV